MLRREARELPEGGEARERLALELADALARQVELVADRLERPRLALEAEPQLEDPPLALGERVERLADVLAAQRLLRLVERVGRLAVGEEVAELALVVGADGLVQRDRRGRGRRAPRRRAGSAGRSPPRARPSSARGRARPRAGARRATASAGARRRGRGRGSCARGSRPRAAPTGGSTRWRRSRTCSRGASRTSRRRGSGRAFPPGSGRGTARRGRDSPSRSRRRGAGSTRSSAASPIRSPRSIAFASVTSSAAVSSLWRPTSARKSCRLSPAPDGCVGLVDDGSGCRLRCCLLLGARARAPRARSARARASAPRRRDRRDRARARTPRARRLDPAALLAAPRGARGRFGFEQFGQLVLRQVLGSSFRYVGSRTRLRTVRRFPRFSRRNFPVGRVATPPCASFRSAAAW